MEILYQDLQNLMIHFAKNLYKAPNVTEKNTLPHDVMERCKELLKVDYVVNEIPNDGGELSSCYPATILIPTAELPKDILGTNGSRSVYDRPNQQDSLRELLKESRYARCRCRFVLPVILYKGKYVCRSATLSGGTEIHARHIGNIIYKGLIYPRSNSAEETENVSEAKEDSLPPPPPPPPPSIENSVVDNNRNEAEVPIQNWLFHSTRTADIRLLKFINVGTIVDLMVEKKKVKYGMYVTSSEKVDKEKRYSEFAIISMPYPGCEFFHDFRQNNYSGKNLVFDWAQPCVDATIDVPKNEITDELQINWEEYKTWDLITITKNYMKLTLQYLQKDESGILIHCISGWDRTPLFVSLLRLSLWADGVIHQKLDANQILYFTIAYDWFLFGHNLTDRLTKGEEIFYFCFYFLGFMMGNEFSTDPEIPKSKTSSGSSISVLNPSSSGSDLFSDFDDTNKEAKPNDFSGDRSSTPLILLGDDEPDTPHSSKTNSHDEDGAACAQPSQNSSNMPKTSPVPIGNKSGRTRLESGGGQYGSWEVTRVDDVLRDVPEHDASTLSEAAENPANTSDISFETIKDFSVLEDANVVDEDGKRLVPSVDNDAPVRLNEDDSKKARSEAIESEGATNGYTTERRQRLNAVRNLFFNLYDSTIGFRIPTEGPSSLIFGNIWRFVSTPTKQEKQEGPKTT